MDFHGLIAAGGVASRLGALPCSKEIFPLANHFNKGRIMVVCENLINYYKQGVFKTYISSLEKASGISLNYLAMALKTR